MLKIHNSLTRQKELFQPIEDRKVRMYVCGMTVYDYCHLGHARVMVVFDMIARYLRYSGYELTYVRNITDIDDKIINRANENNESCSALTERFIAAMHEDEDSLNVLRPDVEPRATTSIEQIIDMVKTLVERGYAYQGSNGDVFYSVAQFEGYGQLSGKKIDELRAGERVGVDQAKRDPLDFVLWKSAKPGEPSWPSPWGEGRPGWHIECSAMSTHCLGHHFDIHGGGMDLQFPHHENEIAQSEAATGEKFANVWIHNGFVRINEEKMSKSLGNFFTIREVLQNFHPEVVRLFILSSHYRSPLNYSDQQLSDAGSALTRLYMALRAGDEAVAGTGSPSETVDAENQWTKAFQEAMDDDFNTSVALSVLFDLAREINKRVVESPETVAEPLVELRKLGLILGILQAQPDEFLRAGSGGALQDSGLSDDEIQQLVDQRLEAKQQKNWGEADRIRDQLKDAGVVLEDAGAVTNWRRG